VSGTRTKRRSGWSIPPSVRLTVKPLSRQCGDCESLTKNGGACPGVMPDQFGDFHKPMCHSVYWSYYAGLNAPNQTDRQRMYEEGRT